MHDCCPRKRDKTVHRRRRKLWEIDSGLHCSVVGTCLTLSDLRRIEARLKIEASREATDFQVHGNFVVWAGKPGPVAKQLHRLLDRRYAGAIRRFGAGTDAAGLRELWTRSLGQGDIPGPYWALLTHPAADAGIIMRAYGQVHMLSHLVGSANRADIRRLMTLEMERDELAVALATARRQLAKQEGEARMMLSEHAAEVRDLTARLSAAACLARRLQAAEHRIVQLQRGDAYRHLQTEAENGRRALAQAERHAEEQRVVLAQLFHDNARLSDTVAGLEDSLRALAAECEAMEWMFREQLSLVVAEQSKIEEREAIVPLCGRRIAYVGGHTGLIPHFRALVERSGGSFLHHDGGIEKQGSRRLDGLLGQCDAVFCPMDCVSHDACLRAKRACKQRAATFVSLRTGSLSSFAEGLRQLSQEGIEGTAARRPDPTLDAGRSTA